MRVIPKFLGVIFREEIIEKVPTFSFGLIMDYNSTTLTSLNNYLKDKKLSSIDKLNIIIKICKIVHYLHSENNNIISRSINPDVLQVDNSGEIYLLDFRYATDNEQNTDAVDINTIRYNAPEVFIQEHNNEFDTNKTGINDVIYNISLKADIWSLGAIMLQLFSGQLPFTGEVEFDASNVLFSFVVKKEITIPENVTKECIGIVPIIKNCLDYNPKNRMSCSELSEKLKELKVAISKSN